MFVESAGVSNVCSPTRARSACTTLAIAAILIVLIALIPVATKAKCQLALVPVIICAFWSRPVGGVRIPKLVLLGTAVGAALGAVFQLSHVSLASGAFLVSTVSDRDLRQEAKIYRDRLRKSIRSEGESLVGEYPGMIRDAASARRVLDGSPSLGGVIWGSPRWMSVELRQYAPLSLSSLPQGSVAHDLLISRGVPDLMLILSVPSIGMSHGHERGTVYFLGEVVRAWRQVPEATAIQAASGEFEGEMEALARTRARWTSRVHMALPLWLSGTVHLLRAIETESLQEGELSCALNELREAIMQFRTNDNPALEMAVRNSYAIALLVQAQHALDGRILRKKACGQLAAAMKLRTYDKKNGATVAMNYMSLIQARKRRVSDDRKR
jgi:hypothetical protein